MAETDAVAVGIWSPFRSLLTAQVLSAALGLVFWVIVARLVDAHDVGVAAAAISAADPARHRDRPGLQHHARLGAAQGGTDAGSARWCCARCWSCSCRRRSVAAWWWPFSPLLPGNLEQALGNPIGAVTFVLGTAGFAWALVVDDACLGVKRSGLQVWRNLVASSLRFPATAVLLLAGVHRRARAPGLLGAAAARLDPVHAVAAPAAAARPRPARRCWPTCVASSVSPCATTR